MNDLLETTPDLISKPKRARKSTPKPAVSRELDPGIIALRAEHAARVKEYRGKKASGAILTTMLKRIVQLTDEDKLKLADALPAVTPPLLK